MAENSENIDLVIRIVDSGIDIKLPRQRSTGLVLNSLTFIVNAKLFEALGKTGAPLVNLVAFDPPGKYIYNVQTLWMIQIALNFYQLTIKLAFVTLLLTKSR